MAIFTARELTSLLRLANAIRYLVSVHEAGLGAKTRLGGRWRGRSRPYSHAAIVQAIRQLGRPLTRGEIIDAFAGVNGLVITERLMRTISNALSKLASRRVLIHDKRAHTYRIAPQMASTKTVLDRAVTVDKDDAEASH